MSDEAWKAIGQIAIFLGVLASILSSLRNTRLARKQATTLEAQSVKLEVVHQDVNGKMAQLVEAVGAKERAAGTVEGRQASISERADRVAESERVEDREAEKAKH